MRKVAILILVIFSLVLFIPSAQAFWIWTPETNKWVNPKHAVKDTPREQLEYAMESYTQKNYAQARVEFLKLIKHYPQSREAAEAQYYIAQGLLEQGELYNAFKEFQVVIKTYPFSERIPDIVSQQFDIGNRMLEGEGKKNAFVHAVIGGDYQIVDVFRTVIKNTPYGEHAPQAQYKIGLYLQEKKLYQEARDEFEKTINDYPDSEWAKAARFQIAMADSNRSASAGYDQAITASAVEEFKDFVEVYPDAELSKKAQEQIYELREKEAENNFLIAKYYEKRKQYKAAKLYFTTVVEDYKDSSWAPKALENIRELNTKITE